MPVIASKESNKLVEVLHARAIETRETLKGIPCSHGACDGPCSKDVLFLYDHIPSLYSFFKFPQIIYCRNQCQSIEIERSAAILRTSNGRQYIIADE
jgi:hypothetical protein